MRSVLAVMAGALAWFVIWASSNAALDAGFPGIKVANQPLTHTPMLLTLLVISVIASVLAGYATARVAANREMAHTLALGALQLALGIYFEWTYWELLPAWYHWVFLVLLVPGNLVGGWFRIRGRAAPLATGLA